MRRNPHDYLLALARVPALGPVGCKTLLARFNSAEQIFSAPRARLLRHGLAEASIAGIQAPDWDAVAADKAWLDGENCHLIVHGTRDYPALLPEIPDPPLVLFVRGDYRALRHPSIAIVGSRRPSRSGREDARAFAGSLAKSGFCVVSGLADGIDGAAHEGAIKVDGLTVAVLGNGLDRIYPRAHSRLAEGIIDSGGALVSEYGVGMPPLPGNFPRRNRIVSGVSLGVLVVEAARRSGALITAHQAAEQGREVFAMPGSIHNPMARGCHALIRRGAKLVETVDHVLEELAPQIANVRTRRTAEEDPDPGDKLEADERRLFDCVDYTATAFDDLAQRSGLSADRVSTLLLLLELKGFVSSSSAGTFTRAR